MEILGAVFSKFTDAIIEEYADMFFVALVLRSAKDNTPKCRDGRRACTAMTRSGEGSSSQVVHGTCQ
jgi:hypothetical protein